MGSLNINERSEAIELIKESQALFEKNDFVFKEASGEQSLGRNGNVDRRAATLFPDVLYYTDSYQNQVALGWELKMPDTDINDIELFNNAVDKANRLKTNAFVLWNFRQVRVFFRERNNDWKESKSWNDLIDITKRDDVIINRDRWKELLKDVIVHLNMLFRDNIVTSVPILQSAENISQNISEIFSRELSDYYNSIGDRKLIIEIRKWYDTELMEFSSVNPNQVSDSEKTRMFAKNILLNWINRITFANLIKSNHNSVFEALRVILKEDGTFEEIKEAFNHATKVSDFFTILNCQDIDIYLSETAKDIIRQYTSFLYRKNFDYLDQEEFQNTLESIVEISKRELMGLYTTPKNLAKLLVASTIENINSEILDPCVGSGTIASSAMHLISELADVKKAHDKVWASDKFRLPLQVANISLSSKDSLNLPNQVFQKDLLSIRVGEKIAITDPRDGKSIIKEIPEFDYIVSNLPFIRNEKLKADSAEEQRIKEVNDYLEKNNIEPLSLKNDWYQFGIVGIERLLKENGKAAVIVSNSWLKTKRKTNYINLLFKLFEVQKVIISANGRWFNNAEVVSVILILKKKSNLKTQNVKFIKLKSNISSLNNEDIRGISDSLLIDDIVDNEYLQVIEYSKEDIQNFIKSGLSLNILFHKITWFNHVLDVTLPMDYIFTGERGTKSTNDKFFYDISPSENIEKEYILPLLKTPSTIQGFFATADSNVFVVDKDRNHLDVGAQKYISKYSSMPKTTSQTQLVKWYQFPKKVTGDFITSINPDQRLFWSSVPSDLLINQRLTVFKLKNKNTNKKLVHALLNTYFAQFMIEATGFGRGLGVLDTTKDGILDSLILNPFILSSDESDEIIKAWEKLAIKEVPNVLEQLYDEEWKDYNRLVLQKYGKEQFLDQIIYSLEHSVKMRASVRK